VLLTLVFASLQTNVAHSPLVNAIPWTAVPLVSFANNQSVIGTSGMIIGLTSIFACGILGLVLACFSFAKQDQ